MLSLLPGVLAATACAALALAPARVDAAPVALGVYVPKADQDPLLIDSFAKQAGRAPAMVSSYKRWRSPPFVSAELGAVWRRGAVPLVSWEPWTLAGQGFPLKAIADGHYDGYVRRAAKSAAAWGRPILLRFAHEMNGTWYSWGRGSAGHTPGIYKAAWRHLVGIFRAAGADNVQWVWTPNVDGGGKYPFRSYFPGNRWVNWVGLDGFNWARRGEWESFTDLFASSYDTLGQITSRPVMIAETGSSQTEATSRMGIERPRRAPEVLGDPGRGLVQRPGRRRRFPGQQLARGASGLLLRDRLPDLCRDPERLALHGSRPSPHNRCAAGTERRLRRAISLPALTKSSTGGTCGSQSASAWRALPPWSSSRPSSGGGWPVVRSRPPDSPLCRHPAALSAPRLSTGVHVARQASCRYPPRPRVKGCT